MRGRDESSRWRERTQPRYTVDIRGWWSPLKKNTAPTTSHHRVPSATAATADRLGDDTGNVTVFSEMLGSTVVPRSRVTLRRLLDDSQSLYNVTTEIPPTVASVHDERVIQCERNRNFNLSSTWNAVILEVNIAAKTLLEVILPGLSPTPRKLGTTRL